MNPTSVHEVLGGRIAELSELSALHEESAKRRWVDAAPL